MRSTNSDRVLVLDFGSQYTQLIARRVRELGVYCEIQAFDWPEDKLRNFAPSAVILSGGAESLTDAALQPSSAVFNLGVPLLGICYGMQLIAAHFGGQVERGQVGEFGRAEVRVGEPSRLFADFASAKADDLTVWMSHGDCVSSVPPGFICAASSEYVPIAAIANDALRVYGLQFHPEVTHTSQGGVFLRRFLLDIAGCRATWTAENIIDKTLVDLRAKLGSDQVILALSGGVDSAVAAALLQRAIGDQLFCVFVDGGLLRQGEGDEVMAVFEQKLKLQIKRVNAQEEFFSALRGVEDPEQKRKKIGALFIEIFEREARLIGDLKWLAQGTIYPDVIESAKAGGAAHLIKSHHNVGGLPEHMSLQLVEPLRMLFKDEVRRIGRELGLPSSLIDRHPFPGPGLAVRILGEVTAERVALLQRADRIFIDELRAADLYRQVAQAFAVFIPVRSVGIVGDGRRYGYILALRAVATVDFMTANWAQLPQDFLARVSSRIINEISEISRVVYDISNKPPATIEWE